MNILLNTGRAAAAIVLASSLGACVIYDTPPSDSPYYESYGYPDNYAGPGYYGPGYYQPGYYGGYWYAGGYYTPSYSGSYAPYPYYPGTHVIIVDRNRPGYSQGHQGGYDDDRDHDGHNRGDGGDSDRDNRRPRDPVGPRPQQVEPQHPFGIPDSAYHGNGSAYPVRNAGPGDDHRDRGNERPQGQSNQGGFGQGPRPPSGQPSGQPAGGPPQNRPPASAPAPAGNIYRQSPNPPPPRRDRAPGEREDGPRVQER